VIHKNNTTRIGTFSLSYTHLLTVLHSPSHCPTRIGTFSLSYTHRHLLTVLHASAVTQWASEESSSVDNSQGGGCWARTNNQNWVNGNLTAMHFSIYLTQVSL
jgi:hypothetical protein